MAIPICKPVYFIFYARTIPGTNSFYPTLKHRTSIKTSLKDIVHSLACIGDEATSLLIWTDLFNIGIRKTYNFLITFLLFHLTVIQTPSINSWRRSRFKSVALEP